MQQETRFSRLLLRKILSFAIQVIFSVKSTLVYKNRIDVTKPCVIAIFHDEMLPALSFMRNTNTVCLASKNHVGAAIGSVLTAWGYQVVYGSPSGRGQAAFKELVQAIKAGKVVMLTPDGSRGPRHTMKAGAILLAKRTNVPLYLISPRYNGIRIKSFWDKFLYPLPFAEVTFQCAKMEINPNSSREETRQQLKEAEELLRNLANPC